MDLGALIPLFVNGGLAGVFLAVFIYLIVGGHLIPGSVYRQVCEENEEYKAALASERARGDAAVAAAAATRDLLLALGGARALLAPEEKH